ncbi:MAG TPA: carotenoid biosynthesis protein [Cryptosporangiaceae bacterium]|nr:carotenoid biosynthesis protein [Cryptosporangiaceae bacterium]
MRERSAGRVGARADARTAVAWALVGLLVLSQMVYPLVEGETRRVLTIATVCLGFAAATTHAALTRGARTALVLVLVTAGGGLLVEAVGTATGWPFGTYAYTGSLGPSVFTVPWIIPLAWTMMAWPAWLAAGWLVAGRFPRLVVAGWALASWDLFLDPQMVDAGHWAWTGGGPALPGVPGIPVTNYAGWLFVGLVMMALLAAVVPAGSPDSGDRPMLVVYLWTYASSVLAHAVFFDLPASAAWGGLAMGLVAVPLAVALWRRPAVNAGVP